MSLRAGWTGLLSTLPDKFHISRPRHITTIKNLDNLSNGEFSYARVGKSLKSNVYLNPLPLLIIGLAINLLGQSRPIFLQMLLLALAFFGNRHGGANGSSGKHHR